MGTNRTIVLGLVSVVVALVVAAFGTELMVYAQQTPPTQPQPPAAAPARKPATSAKQKSRSHQEAPAQPPNNPAAAQPQQPPTVFDEHARQGNITTCANVFGALGRGLAANSTFTAKTQWDAKAGNAHSVQSMVALDTTQNNVTRQAAGVVFAAPIGSSCEGNLVRVTPNPENCATVAGELAKLNGQSGTLGDLQLITLPNGAQVTLVPFGNACIAVTALRVAG